MTNSQRDTAMRYVPNYHSILDIALQNILRRKFAALVVGCTVDLPNAMDVQVANMSNLTRVLLVTPWGDVTTARATLDVNTARATLEEEGYTVIDADFIARNLLILSYSDGKHTCERTYVLDSNGTSLATFVMDSITSFMQESHVANPYNEHSTLQVECNTILQRISTHNFGVSVPNRPLDILKYVLPKLYEKRLSSRMEALDRRSSLRRYARNSVMKYLDTCLKFLQ